jgi:hypothetical protein
MDICLLVARLPKVNGLLLLTFCLSVFLVGCRGHAPTERHPQADRVIHEKRSDTVYDLAVLVDQSAFTEEYLFSLSQQILSKEAGRYKLIRVTFASSERWLALALPRGSYSYQNPRRYSDEATTSQIAQMLYRNGSVVLRILIGSRVAVRQPLGDGDPSKLDFGTETVSLSSFNVLSGDMIIFYLEADPLPVRDQWNALYLELKRLSGALKVSAAVRPDTQFGEMGGWMFDVFQLPYPNIPLEEYDRHKYLGCSERTARGAPVRPDGFDCEYRTTGFSRPLKVD